VIQPVPTQIVKYTLS